MVCESLALDLPVRSGRGCRSPVWSPRSGVVCARWASGPLGFHIPRKRMIMGVSSLLRVSSSVCGCIRALDVPGAGCPAGGRPPPSGVVESVLLLARDVQSAVPYLRSSVLLHCTFCECVLSGCRSPPGPSQAGGDGASQPADQCCCVTPWRLPGPSRALAGSPPASQDQPPARQGRSHQARPSQAQERNRNDQVAVTGKSSDWLGRLLVSA